MKGRARRRAILQGSATTSPDQYTYQGARSTALWPPNDTEESIHDCDRHGLDVFTVRLGINEEAHRVAGVSGLPWLLRRDALPWQALTQVTLLGLWRPDGSAYTVLPDMFVYPRPMDRRRWW